MPAGVEVEAAIDLGHAELRPAEQAAGVLVALGGRTIVQSGESRLPSVEAWLPGIPAWSEHMKVACLGTQQHILQTAWPHVQALLHRCWWPSFVQNSNRTVQVGSAKEHQCQSCRAGSKQWFVDLHTGTDQLKDLVRLGYSAVAF